ncbi:MAG TPA: TIGR04255 family protein [Humisphaera sp.]|nr:TIGR04255 family protein [Humisphaera sp.]
MPRDVLPIFATPPVAEAILSVQFDRLTDFSAAHAGWFWKDYLPHAWSNATVKTAPYLEDQREKFGSDRVWIPPFGAIIRPHAEPDRTQIARLDADRMIQLQSTRFIYNWRKGNGPYPTFKIIRDEFWPLFRDFCKFSDEASLGKIQPNQWEVTYVNFIPKGDLWDTPSDWKRILPGLWTPPVAGSIRIDLEDCGGEWRFAIEGSRGRLHANLKLARVNPEGPDILALQLTARGPASPADSELSIEVGFDIGHRAIVGSFAAMTSDEAQRYWGRSDI